LIKIIRLLVERADVQAVLSVLKRRVYEPYPERLSMAMDQDAGKTWIGAILWNTGTLIQDYPNAFIVCGFVLLSVPILYLIRAIF